MNKYHKKASAYHPLRQQKEPRSFVIGSWDVETQGLNGKLLLASWYIENMNEPQVIRGTPKQISKGIINVFKSYPNVRFYAHNAQYDFRYIIDDLLAEYSDSIEFFMRTEQDVFMIKTKDFTLVDSFALWGQSLKKFAQVFLPDLPKLEIDIEHFDVTNPDHVNYAKRDAEVLVKCLIKFDEVIYSLFGTHIGLTIAGTAVRAWRREIEESFFKPQAIDAFVRTAYFGGAVLGRFGVKFKNLITYDINSSYPYVMREYGVPYGSYAKTEVIIKDLLGIYRVKVSTPDDLIFPILPKREDKGGIIWPSGTFITTATNIELEFAQEQGYKILEVYEGLVWNDTVNPFVDFVTYCEESRKKYKGSPLEIAIKLIQNSVYGKFGTREERARLFIPQEDEDYIGATPWGVNEKLWISKEVDRDILALPQWAVFITANARLHLLRTIYEHGVENVVYCDTDSITTSVPFPDKWLGEAYGKFKEEKRWDTFYPLAPKVYSGKDATGEYKGAVKGIPRGVMNSAKYKELLDEGVISASISIIPSFKQVLKGNKKTKVMVRRSTDPDKAKSWKKNEAGVMRPVKLKEE